MFIKLNLFTQFFIANEVLKVDLVNSFFYDVFIQLVTFASTVCASLIIFNITEKKKNHVEQDRKERENAIYYLDQYLTLVEDIREAINQFNLHYGLTGRKPKFNIESFDPIFHIHEAEKYLSLAASKLERFEFLFVQFPEKYELLDKSVYIYKTYRKQLDLCVNTKNEVFHGNEPWEVKKIDFSLISNNDLLVKYNIDIINFFYNVIQEKNSF